MRTNHLFISLIALLAILMSSCSEERAVTGADGTQTFTFDLTTDGQAQTRVAAPTVPGYKLKYFLQVLDAKGDAITSASKESGTARFDVELPIGATYTCLFWAHYITDTDAANEYFTVTDLKAVTLIKHLTGDDQCQAFCANAVIAADAAPSTHTIMLKRAVTQVNIKTDTKMEDYSKLTARYSQVPNTFNVADNKVTSTGSVTAPADFTVTTFNTVSAGGDGRFTYQSAYFLASADGVGSMLKMEIKTYNNASPSTPLQTLTIANVPTRKNFKTNVVMDFDPASMAYTYTCDFEDWETNDNTVIHTSLWDGVPATGSSTGSAFSGGTGAADNAYLISSAADLAQLAADVNADYDYAGKYFKLTVDINLNNHEWTPIGIYFANNDAANKAFAGTFDGEHHKIKQLAVTSSANKGSIGLFGYLENGNIYNLHVSGTVSTTELVYVGGIVGGAIGRAENTDIYQIKGCSFDGSASNSYSGGSAAGICGAISGIGIHGCVNRGAITAGKDAAGITNWCQSMIKACYNEGTITAANIAAGIASSMMSATNVSGCYNIGTIAGTATIKEAIAHYSDSGGSTTDSYSKSKMSANHVGELEFASGAWPVSTEGTVWYASPSNDGSANKYWKSIGSWNSGTPEYPKLWWE